MADIEVERKFKLTPDIRARLLDMNLPSTRYTIRDQYYGEELALANRWLRNRNGIWELKLPVDKASNGNTIRNGAIVYREIVGANVWDELNLTPPSSTAWSLSDDDDDDSQEDFPGLECFAALTTERMVLVFPWRQFDVNITLDDCWSDDGFKCSVGELEVVVDTDDIIDDASDALSDLSSFLNVKSMEDSDGKLLKYIMRKRPKFYQSLLCMHGQQ